MEHTRRWFLQRSGIGTALLLARFQGLPAMAAQASPAGASPCLLHSQSPYAPFIEAFVPQIEPGNDNFVVEKYAAAVGHQLIAWSEALRAAPPQGAARIELSLAPNLLAAAVGTPSVHSQRSAGTLTTALVSFPQPRPFTPAALGAELRAYLSPFAKLRVAEFQVSAAQLASESPFRLATEVHYDLCGQARDGSSEERTGIWAIDWETQTNGDWRVVRWAAQAERRSRLAGPGFVDVTSAWMPDVPSYQHQLQHGTNYWRTVLDGASGIDIYGNNGVALGDFDGDGFDDLYVCQPAGLPNRLYRNRGDGTFQDVTEKAGVGVLDGTSSALFVDLNNTGRQDLIVVRTSGPLLFVNRGDDTFELRPDAFHFARAPQGTFTAVAAADYNNDGLLDLYFCLYSYYQGLSEYQFPQPYYDARNGPPNFLLRNRGDFVFDDVTAAAGMDQNNDRYSFACGWNDFNNDGWPDLYVVNDFGRKNLYRNKGDGTFEDIAAQAGVDDPGAGMSVCWFDYDNDGFDDLYVANMWSAAGKRITTQTAFLPNADPAALRAYRKHANGDSLFHNQAASSVFNNVTDSSGTRIGRWAWSSDAWDIDHDGYPDLYVTNGFVSGPERDNLSSFFWRQIVARSNGDAGDAKQYADAWSAINEFIRSDHSWSGYQRNNFYLNGRDGSFTEAAGVLGLDFLEDSRSFALGDLNRDGRLEVVLKNRGAPQLRILQNELHPLGASISFSLRGAKSNRDAIGAVVEIHTADGKQRNAVRAGSGFLAQHSKTLLFGLGDAPGPVHATVHWPSGATQTLDALPAGHHIEVREGESNFHATAFRPFEHRPPAVPEPVDEALPTTFATWLVEPLLAPGFHLPDTKGVLHSLSDGAGSPQLLLLVQSGCAASRQLLSSCEHSAASWKAAGLRALALRLDQSGSAVEPPAATAVPVLVADDTVRGVYAIFYRYLFERRRDMPVPSALLIDPQGMVLKVYSGGLQPESVLQDWHNAPSNAEARMQTALPFQGRYFGHGLHHNYFTYGVAYLQYGYVEQALTAFQQSIARTPNYAPAYYNLGLIYLNKSNIDDAQANLEKAVALDAGNADAWNNLGVVYGQKSDYADARRCFRKALDLEPTHLLAIQNLVKLYEYQGRTSDALALLSGAVNRAPSQSEFRIGYAMLLFQTNDLAGASEQFQHAVQLDPSNVEALNGLGVVLMRQGDNQAAMQRFEQCVQIAPEFDRPYLNLAVLYVQAGQAQRARTLLSAYLSAHPGNDDIRQALTQVSSQ